MTTFYDYDMTVRPRHTTYVLRANMKMMPVGGCTVSSRADGGWVRKTHWGSNGSIRYQMFTDLDEALASGIAWAQRREQQHAKEIADAAARRAAFDAKFASIRDRVTLVRNST